MATKSNDVTGWYGSFFNGWQAKVLGPQPTAAQLTASHGLGTASRHGKQVLACAMALRPCGVTGAQIVIACGAPQLNRMRGLISDGLVKRLPTPADGKGHTVYRLELTTKGQNRIKGAAAAEAPKVTKAAKKPVTKKVKPVTVPVATVATPETPAEPQG